MNGRIIVPAAALLLLAAGGCKSANPQQPAPRAASRFETIVK